MKIIKLILALLLSICASKAALAQFREQAFTQQYNSDVTKDQDSTAVLFSFKEYFAGLGHKQEIGIGTMAAGSALVIGGCQIYNQDYWKLPIVYGAIAGSAGAGLILQSQGNSQAAKYCYIGAGLAYWATMMDGVISYKPDDYPHSGKATLYSILVPGLGQIYNKEYWKLPIYLGAMGFGFHYHADCVKNYNRFRDLYIAASDPSTASTSPISADQALYYRNVYRRYRDYAVLAIAALYLLQVVDANVFSYMHGFEVDDNISFKLEPTVLAPEMQLASLGPNPALGLRLGISF